MKVLATIPLYAMYLLGSVLAQPTGGSVDIPHGNLRPVRLEFGKMYTQADLERIYSAGHDVNASPSESFGETDVGSSVNVRLHSDMEPSLIQAPINLSQVSGFDWTAECKMGGALETHLKMHVTFNGKNFYFLNDKGSGIHHFGATTIGGGHGDPVTSTAEYVHHDCYAVGFYHMCSYYHFGVAKASYDPHAKNPGIVIGAVEPSDTDSPKRPFTIETCRQVKSAREGLPCPVHNGKNKPCTFPGILVTPYP